MWCKQTRTRSGCFDLVDHPSSLGSVDVCEWYASALKAWTSALHVCSLHFPSHLSRRWPPWREHTSGPGPFSCCRRCRHQDTRVPKDGMREGESTERRRERERERERERDRGCYHCSEGSHNLEEWGQRVFPVTSQSRNISPQSAQEEQSGESHHTCWVGGRFSVLHFVQRASETTILTVAKTWGLRKPRTFQSDGPSDFVRPLGQPSLRKKGGGGLRVQGSERETAATGESRWVSVCAAFSPRH